MRYHPETAPDPEEWLATPEEDRLDAARRHHQRAKQDTGRLHAHAAIHVIVENQLAEGHAAAIAALNRLIAEGLRRHEAVHAIGSIVAVEMFEVVKSKRPHDPEAYARRLQQLTAAAWRAGKVE
jgi:hypothetical protein